jgi:hypothetical protein
MGTGILNFIIESSVGNDMEEENSKVEWKTCSNCGHYIIIHRGSDHAELCEWLKFRDITCPEINWSLIDAPDESRYVLYTIMTMGLEYKAFYVSSLTGKYVDVFTPSHIAEMIKLYYSGKDKYADGFAGMTLAEFLMGINDE